MTFENKIINNIPVLLIKSDKFKTVNGTLYFKRPISKETKCLNNFLNLIIPYSCKKYDTSEKLSFELLKNYDSQIGSSNIRYGAYNINRFTFSCVNDKYVNDDVIDKTIDIFNEIILHPNISDDMFKIEDYNFIYKKMKMNIESKKENPRYYGLEKTLINMDKDMPYAIFDDENTLKEVTNKSLYQEYLDMINNSCVNLIILGDGDLDNYADKITKNLETKTYDDEKFPENKYDKEPIKDLNETINTSGSVLFLGTKIFGLSKYERLYVMPLYAAVLGGGASSRLFQKVREEKSLAYYCYTSYQKDDNVLLITSGIDDKNYEKAKELIIKTMDTMEKLNEDEVSRAKEEIIGTLKEINDYPFAIIDYSYSKMFFEDKRIDEKIESFRKVTLEDIINVHKKIKLDTIYFLKGVK